MQPTVRILGTRGVPANHGGFETAAENLGLELVRRGWRVVVYCQTLGASTTGDVDDWNGIERVHLPDRFAGPLGTVWFDALAVRHASRTDDVCLTLGYNTAFLNEALRVRKVPTIINMDGVEWKRARWSRAERHFLHLNERLACRIGDHLIADHPEIARHLRSIAPRARIATITYGAPAVHTADDGLLKEFGVERDRYFIVVARPVAENSVLEIVQAFSRQRRDAKLVVLGEYGTEDPYHCAVRRAAGPEVVFAGAVYDSEVVSALRFHARGYVHGHTVGGTNPSLVEALGCGSPVIAHDNVFNRWVAGDSAMYFTTVDDISRSMDHLLHDDLSAARMSAHARDRHASAFSWSRITDQYEQVLRLYQPAQVTMPTQRRASQESASPRPVSMPAQRGAPRPARIHDEEPQESPRAYSR